MGSVNVDDGVVGQEVPNGGSRCGSPTQRDNGLMRKSLGDRFGLHHAKSCFSIGGENISDRTAFALNDEGICIDVVNAQPLGQQAPNLGFARTGQADEDDGALSTHARSPTTARYASRFLRISPTDRPPA